MKSRTILLSLLPFAIHTLYRAIAPEKQRPEVTLGETRLLGLRNEHLNVEFFGGIPFAEPPLGSLRLHPPILKTALNSSEFDASRSGLACLQTGLSSNAVTEDCLTLNIFRPMKISSGEKLPVLFWIHGGGWLVGSGGRYNGSSLISRGITRGTPVLFVAANYRLGPLGFPLGEEAASAGVLNLGLRDQLAALRWVKANIEAFGGDPSKVTIFGESAGGRSIDLLLFNEEINDLASGAILESDPGTSLLDPPLTNQVWSGFVSAVTACSTASNTMKTLDCLRSEDLSSNELLQAYIKAGIVFGLSPWGPIIDGVNGLVPTYTSQSTIKAKFPIIIGNCLDEGTLATSQAPSNTSSDDTIRNLIKAVAVRPPGREVEIEQIVDRVLEAYPNTPTRGSPFGTGDDTFGLDSGYKRTSAVVGDFIFQSHRRLMLERLSQRPQKQLYSFVFADYNDGMVTVPREFILGSPVPGSLGAAHSAEIFYVFGTLEDELGPGKVAKTALDLSQTMMDYWISFAVTGDPNDGRGASRPRWTPFNPDDPMIIQLKGQDIRMIPDTFREQGISVFNEDTVVLRR
ncbi:hypothetical protein V5O48_012624 [Marasmius crinis-equi]|uniref:Carboxylic ester hydrolase n=1 Tax=Marasmius crinis-equi TaxID=585013 RepID=A0ABR3F295_9AGAR